MPEVDGGVDGQDVQRGVADGGEEVAVTLVRERLRKIGVGHRAQGVGEAFLAVGQCRSQLGFARIVGAMRGKPAAGGTQARVSGNGHPWHPNFRTARITKRATTRRASMKPSRAADGI